MKKRLFTPLKTSCSSDIVHTQKLCGPPFSYYFPLNKYSIIRINDTSMKILCWIWSDFRTHYMRRNKG